MTTIELQQWRESFIERYLNKIDDMETVLKIEKYMKRIMSKANAASPISFSLKEANKRIVLYPDTILLQLIDKVESSLFSKML